MLIYYRFLIDSFKFESPRTPKRHFHTFNKDKVLLLLVSKYWENCKLPRNFVGPSSWDNGAQTNGTPAVVSGDSGAGDRDSHQHHYMVTPGQEADSTHTQPGEIKMTFGIKEIIPLWHDIVAIQACVCLVFQLSYKSSASLIYPYKRRTLLLLQLF